MASTSSSTVRYYAASRYACARALLELAAYARTHQDDFSFGPLDLAALEHQGLAITGPDVAGAAEILDMVPGLVREQA